MYLYVDRSEGLKRVPDSLLDRFGHPLSALVLELHPQRRLARASASDVLDAIETQGFYLQMPPRTQDGCGESSMQRGVTDQDAD